MSKKISEMTPSELMTEMSKDQLDAIYKMVRSDYIYYDTIARIRDKIKDKEIELDEYDIEETAYAVADAWVYQGKYDCSASYWDNIDALVRNYIDY